MDENETNEALFDIADSLKSVRKAITPCVAGNHDATGAYVESLTEAVMGMTAGLIKIAEAISELAEAVREHD